MHDDYVKKRWSSARYGIRNDAISFKLFLHSLLFRMEYCRNYSLATYNNNNRQSDWSLQCRRHFLFCKQVSDWLLFSARKYHHFKNRKNCRYTCHVCCHFILVDPLKILSRHIFFLWNCVWFFAEHRMENDLIVKASEGYADGHGVRIRFEMRWEGHIAFARDTIYAIA